MIRFIEEYSKFKEKFIYRVRGFLIGYIDSEYNYYLYYYCMKIINKIER